MNQTLIRETIDAARGVLGLLLGRRDASRHFNLSLQGLMGSLIAFLIAIAFNAYMPVVMGAGGTIEQPFATVSSSLIIYAAQIAMAILVLRQFGRTDGLVPYLVCDNWASFYTTFASFILLSLGLNGEFAVILLTIVALVLLVNNARLIVTLNLLQILGFIVAQMVGVMVAMLVVNMLFPDLMAATQDAVQSSFSSGGSSGMPS
ncbi:MAG: hypothetical protein KDJ19_09740 [Hyphomicrobiaceae bacterium]|nr:hypothetical protein [Hyphomicrobiaceae bacterium]MCC0022675.1 hypothetical protein [Hyphomicrobiaceae bacterium]